MKNVSSRLGKLEKEIGEAGLPEVCINCSDTEDFQQQRALLIDAGVDERKVHLAPIVDDSLSQLLREIDGTSRGLPVVHPRSA